MKKGNVVDLRDYRKAAPPSQKTLRRDGDGASKELQLAIKRLIRRMRKQGPMKRVKRA